MSRDVEENKRSVIGGRNCVLGNQVEMLDE